MASAELYSTEAHFYGRFEARIRYAPGDGVVSSFFLWKEGSNGTSVYWNELDFEKVGANCEMHTNAYYGMPASQHTQTNAMPGDICADYHTYAFEWAPTYIAWSVDGKEFRRETGATATAFAQNATAGMTIHFNIWPGNSSFGGNISKTTLPVREYISWVQYSSYDNGTFKLQSRQEFDGSGIPAGWAVGNWSSPFNLSTHNPQNVSFVNGIAVMSLTNDNATGNPGTPPADSAAAGGAPGSGGSAAGGTTGTGAGGASGGATGSGGSTGAGGKAGSGGTTSSGSGGAATNGGAVGSGGAQNAGGALAQGGTTTVGAGGTSDTNGGSNAAGGSNSSSNAGGSAGSATTTIDSAGGSAAGGNSSKTSNSGGCNMTGAGRGAGTATFAAVLGVLGIGAFRRARRQRHHARRPGLRTWLGLFAAVLIAWACPAEAKPYKGAEVYLLKSVLYGRVEVRMRMIRGSGLLSTFFTYKDGSEKSGNTWEETDIEVLGKNDAKSWQSNLITGSPRKTSEQVYSVSTSLADDYHTYTLEWAPTYVSWYLDGTLVRKTEGGQAADLVNSETLRFNAWSSTSSGWAGTLDEAALPAYQFVNWIKYYRYDNGQFTLDWSDDFDSFDSSRWGKGTWTFDGNQVDFDPSNAVVQDGTLILAITKEGATGFSGTVPADSGNTNPGTITTPTSHQDSGCSIAQAYGSRGATSLFALLAAGLLAVRAQRRRRAKATNR